MKANVALFLASTGERNAAAFQAVCAGIVDALALEAIALALR
jgi:hypothetical protein